VQVVLHPPEQFPEQPVPHVLEALPVQLFPQSDDVVPSQDSEQPPLQLLLQPFPQEIEALPEQDTLQSPSQLP